MAPDVLAPVGLVQPAPEANSVDWLWFRPERELAYGSPRGLCTCAACDVRQAAVEGEPHPRCFMCGRFISVAKRTYLYV